MMSTFRKPDLNAPRRRKKVLEVVDKNFCKEFQKKYPKYSDLSLSDIKEIIKKQNEALVSHICENRDGVELPEQLGYIFLGSWRSKWTKKLVDYGSSIKHNTKVHSNYFTTDGHICKITYSNSSLKYKFTDSEIWCFEACRNFTRKASKSFKENWQIYACLNHIRKVSELFLKQVKQNTAIKISERKLNLAKGTYNEFEI